MDRGWPCKYEQLAEPKSLWHSHHGEAIPQQTEVVVLTFENMQESVNVFFMKVVLMNTTPIWSIIRKKNQMTNACSCFLEEKEF